MPTCHCLLPYLPAAMPHTVRCLPACLPATAWHENKQDLDPSGSRWNSEDLEGLEDHYSLPCLCLPLHCLPPPPACLPAIPPHLAATCCTCLPALPLPPSPAPFFFTFLLFLPATCLPTFPSLPATLYYTHLILHTACTPLYLPATTLKT